MKLKEYSYTASISSPSTATRILSLVGNGKRVLELGCSSGTQSRVLHEELKCEVTGIEINAVAAEKARKYCKKVIVSNLNDSAIHAIVPNETFDVVLCADVLEHLIDPLITLKNIKKVIDRNGYIVISVPNIAHSALIFELANGIFEYRDRGLLDDTHIKFFTRQTLIATLSDAGYKIVQLERALAWPIDTEFNVRQIKKEDQLLLDYIITHNPEALTYQFIAKAEPSEDATEEIYEYNDNFSRANLANFIKENSITVESSQKRINNYFEVFPHAHAELSWLREKTLFRFAESIMNHVKRALGRNVDA